MGAVKFPSILSRKIVEETIASGRATLFQIATEAGFIEMREGKGKGQFTNVTTFKRRLGMADTENNSSGRIRYDVAVRIIEACGLLPVEVGL